MCEPTKCIVETIVSSAKIVLRSTEFVTLFAVVCALAVVDIVVGSLDRSLD